MTRGFTARPVVRGIGGRWVENLEPLEYVDDARGFKVVVPQFFVSDGASVPRWAWAMLKSGFVELLPHGLLHDALYRSDATLICAGSPVAVPSQFFADGVMVQSMRADPGIARRDPVIVRAGLFLGGWTSYQKRALDWRPPLAA